MDEQVKKRTKEKPKPLPKPVISDKNRRSPSGDGMLSNHGNHDSGMTESDTLDNPAPNDQEISTMSEPGNHGDTDVNGNAASDVTDGNTSSHAHRRTPDIKPVPRSKPASRPTPRPRTSLLKKDSISESNKNCINKEESIAEDSLPATLPETPTAMIRQDLDLDRSISQSSSQSLTRSNSYEAALNRQLELEAEDSSSDGGSNANKQCPSQASSQLHVQAEDNASKQSDDNIPKRKAPPPPRPTVGPVGVLPTGELSPRQVPSREGSPGPSAMTPPRGSSPLTQIGDVRSASPPCTRPKPSRRIVDQALSTQNPGGLTPPRPLTSSISTPNIAKHQREGDGSPTQEQDDLQSGDIKNKMGGSVSQMVQALTKIGGNTSDKKAETAVKRRSGSQFYFDLDGSETGEVKDKKSQRRNSSGSSGKKEKRKSEKQSVFYRDVAVSAGGTLKFEGVADREGKQKVSKKTSKKKVTEWTGEQNPAVTCQSDSAVEQKVDSITKQVKTDVAVDELSSNNDSSFEAVESKHSKVARRLAKQSKLEDSSDKDVFSSDGNNSPVAPPRTKRRSKLFKESQELSLRESETPDTSVAKVVTSEPEAVSQAPTPDTTRPEPEGQVATSDQVYENYPGSGQDAASRPPTILIRPSSAENLLECDTTKKSLSNQTSQPSQDEMDDIYLPMSLSMPGGFGNPAHHRFSDISTTSTISDDYMSMTGENLHQLLLGRQEIQVRDKRSSSWSGPDTDEALESALGALQPPDEALHNVSQSTEDTDTSASSDDEKVEDGQKQLIVQSLLQVKAKLEKKQKKIFRIAEEMMTSERSFVNVLKLINEDFREAMKAAKGPLGGPVIPYREIDQILKLLPLLQNFSEDLLKDLETRVNNWETNPKIADVFVEKGPFLKMYTTYIQEFEPMCAALEESRKRYPEFDKAANEFEASSHCSNLAIKHFMLKPIQRIPQYRLMLQEYLKNLTDVSPDYEDTKVALSIVSEVAEHANSSMVFGDNLKKLLEIQNELIGQFEVIKPGRLLVKSGELQKLSRKEKQRRMFFLFTDTLLCTTFVSTGYKYNSELPLAGMKVTKPDKDDFNNEFSIVSTTRSFKVAASSLAERDDWLKVLQDTVKEYNKKRYTYQLKSSSTSSEPQATTPVEEGFKLGQQPPVWVPDSRVSMCAKCHEEFTVTFRRHHCRACGKVFCWLCCDNRAPLRYQGYKAARVCNDCFEALLQENGRWQDSLRRAGHSKEERMAVIQLGRAFIRGSNRGQGTLFSSFGKGRRKRATILQEVKAMEADTDMSGYMGVWESKRWKKYWFVLKEKVLYFYKASEDTAAFKTMALVGFEVRLLTESFQKTEVDMLFEVTHKNIPSVIFKVKEKLTRDKWVKAVKLACAP